MLDEALVHWGQPVGQQQCQHARQLENEAGLLGAAGDASGQDPPNG